MKPLLLVSAIVTTMGVIIGVISYSFYVTAVDVGGYFKQLITASQKQFIYKVPEGVVQIYVCGQAGSGGDSNGHSTPSTPSTCLPVDTDGKEISIEIGKPKLNDRGELIEQNQ